MEFLRKTLSRIVLFSYQRPMIVAAGLTAVLVISFIFLPGLRFESVTPAVGQSENSLNSLYIENMERFGDSSPLVISLLPGEASPEAFDVLTDRLAEEIASWADILYVDSKPVDLGKEPSGPRLIRAALLNSGPEAREAFAERLTPSGMRRTLLQSRRKIIAVEDPHWRALIAADVLALREFVLPLVETRQANLKFSMEREYFDDRAGSSRLLFVQPAKPSEDAEFSRALLSRIDGLLQSLKSSVQGTDSVEHRFAGKYALSGEAVGFLKREMMLITLVASVLMLAIMWGSFRRARAILLCFLPVMFSLLLVLLLARFFFNPLNTMAMSLAAVVVGLGIDVMIHLTGRFYQLAAGSPSIEEAVELSLRDSGRPIAIGMTTTAAAFLCLLTTEYRAIAQFGILTSAGLLISLALSLFLFPAMVRLFGPRKPEESPALLFRRFPRKLYLGPLRRPRLSIFAVVVLVTGGALLARHFSFDMDLLKLLPRKLKSIENSRDVSSRFGASFISDLQLTIQADDPASGMAAQRLVDGRLADLVRQKKIAGFQSPSLYFPYEESTPSLRSFLETARETAKESEEEFFALLEELRFRRTTEYEDYYRMIESAVAGDLDLRLLKEGMLSPRMRRFLVFEEGRVYFQTYAWPGNDLDDLGAVKAVSRDLQDLALPAGTSVYTTGTFQVFDQIIRMIRADFFRVSLLSLAAIMVILFLYFRRVSMVLLCLLPVASAVVVTLGFIVLSGIRFTPAGIGITALILGIGIDDAVHIIARVSGKKDRAISTVVKEIGPVITLTSLTTVAGFGSLMLASNSLVFSFGAVIAFGILVCLLFTILLIPPLFTLLFRGA